MSDITKREINLLSRWKGSFVGLAIGDQLGSLVEGKSRGTFDRVTGMMDGSFWTDDTSQALCIADSLISKKSLDISERCYVLVMGKNFFEGKASEVIQNKELGRMFLGNK